VSEPRHRLSPDTGKQGEAAPKCLRGAAAQTAAHAAGGTVPAQQQAQVAQLESQQCMCMGVSG